VAFAAGWRALAGPAADPDAVETLDPEARLLRAEQSDLITFALRLLPVRRRRIVCQYFGMAAQRARSTREIADTEEISAGRAADIVQRGCAHIRWLLTRARKLPSLPLPSQRRPREASEEQYRRLLLIAADRSIAYSRYSAAPELYARPPRRMRHDSAFPARWYRLPRPIVLHEAALLLQRLSQRLNIDPCITMTMVSEQSLQTPESSAGAERIGAFWWQTPFFWAKHQGGEARGIGIDGGHRRSRRCCPLPNRRWRYIPCLLRAIEIEHPQQHVRIGVDRSRFAPGGLGGMTRLKA
jgi:hypothetical protein